MTSDFKNEVDAYFKSIGRKLDVSRYLAGLISDPVNKESFIKIACSYVKNATSWKGLENAVSKAFGVFQASYQVSSFELIGSPIFKKALLRRVITLLKASGIPSDDSDRSKFETLFSSYLMLSLTKSKGIIFRRTTQKTEREIIVDLEAKLARL
jgi:hypothetical protein